MSSDADRLRDQDSTSAKVKSNGGLIFWFVFAGTVVTVIVIAWFWQSRSPTPSSVVKPGVRSAAVRRMLELAYERNENDKAIELCHQYAVLEPQDAYPWLILAGLYHSRADRSAAIQAYREALSRKLSVGDAERAGYQLVGLLMDQGDLEGARVQADLLLKNPATSRQSAELIAIRQADLLRREGRLDAALATVNPLLEKNPELVTALSIRGLLQFDLGHDQAAIDDLVKVVLKDEYDQPAHYKLGQAYLRLGKRDEGKAHMKRSQELIELDAEIMMTTNQLENAPGNLALQKQLANLYERRGNSEMAARWKNMGGGTGR